MKTVDYPCEHGYYGLCTQCVREERNELRARVAELEARIAELQPMAKCAAIMAVCGYFSRMRGPDAWLDHGSWDEYPELFACAGVDLRSFQHGTRFYAGSAPVPAAQAEADDDEATDSEADAVVRDAERYRWMREDMKNLWGDDVLAIVGESGRHFDAAIDAAMLAAKAKGG